MIGFISAAPVRRRPTRESIAARTLALDPDLRVGSEPFAAAAVLVAGLEVGHNVDRLARLTGVSRETVARMARRLVDNGVWMSGNTVSHWCDDPSDLASFRRDVAVAEGRLCRQMDASGKVEWAPQGYWRKDFEYSGPKADISSHVVRYHPHVPVPEAECLFVPEDDFEMEDEVRAAASSPVAERAGDDALPHEAEHSEGVEETAVWLGGADASEPAADAGEDWKASLPGALGGGEGGAVWLGWEDAASQQVNG